MTCPKCGSNNVTIQAVSESQLKTKHRSIFWWLLIGFWWIPLKWFVFTLPALIIKIFAPKRQKLKTKHFSMAICQHCGYSWKV